MIDTHAHLYMCKTSAELLVQQAKASGLIAILNVAVNAESAVRVREMADRFPSTYPTAGIHPLYPEHFQDLSQIADLIAGHPERWHAVGEIGLDYKYDCDKAAQRRLFQAQLELARRYKKPAIVHVRQAEDDVAAILAEFPDVPAVIHCYSHSPEYFHRCYRENLMVSFTGLITYPTVGKIADAVREIPLDRIMVETDCPYLTPAPYRGQENHPARVVETAKEIARLRNISDEEVGKVTTANAIRFFQLPLTPNV